MVFLLEPSWTTAPLLLLTALAVALLTRRELRTPDPFLDLRVLGGNRPLLLTYTRMLLAQTVGYAVLYGYSQWLQEGRGLSPDVSGLLLLPLSASALGVAALTGRNPRIRTKLVVGAVLQVALAGGLLLLRTGTPLWLLVALMVLAGIPQGLNNLALQNAVYRQADPATLGASSGLLRTFMYVGAMVASAAAALSFGRVADTGGLHTLAWFLGAVALVFLLITVADRSLSAAPHPQETR
jgi:hypothetical protein